MTGEVLRHTAVSHPANTSGATGHEEARHYFDEEHMVDPIANNAGPVGALATFSMKDQAVPIELILSDDSNYIWASDLSERIDARGGDDRLAMGGGDDTAIGGAGNDVLDGGTGNDLLRGDAGMDEYVLRSGSGNDTIDAAEASDYPMDMLRFEDVPFDGVTAVLRSGDDLILQYGAGDQVTVLNHFINTTSGIAQVIFSDQTVMTEALFRDYPVHLTDGDDSVTFPLNQFERVFAGAGNDVVMAGGDDDLLYGESGNDNLHGDDGNDYLAGGVGLDSMQGGNGDDTLMGDEGDDRLAGNDGQDTLNGGMGDDTLDGGAGDNTLDGGAGNDSMTGGPGNDLFLLRSGSGTDRINLHEIDSPRIDGTPRFDVLRFEGVPSTSLTAATREGQDLTLHYGDGDSVTIEAYYDGESYRFSWIELSDINGNLEPSWIMSHVAVALGGQDDRMSFTGDGEHILAGAGNDAIAALDGDDTVAGEAGNDSLVGDAGNDVLDGGDGNDSLTGGDGDDVLAGGTGNDSMTGGAGNDVFLLRAGSGADRIDLHDTAADRYDVVRFEDVATTDVTALTREGADLTLHFGAGDSVTFESYYTSAADRFSSLEFADINGGLWPELLTQFGPVSLTGQDNDVSFTDATENILGGAGNDTIAALDGDDTVSGEAGNDSLAGNAGNDILTGGAGDDVLAGGAGDDTISGDAGDDLLIGGEGLDVYVFHLGDGNDTVEAYTGLSGEPETLRFADVMLEQLSAVSREGDDLVIAYGPGDQVTIADYFAAGEHDLTFIEFADSASYLAAQLIGIFEPA